MVGIAWHTVLYHAFVVAIAVPGSVLSIGWDVSWISLHSQLSCLFYV